ncbi:monocarboxylate transporter 13 [Cuculus canorus]|uniref:monocarboxylate transporter 13 n=1 Tax=Cuculus canorus TaxID=55661 RepID=UPI0023AB2AE0|nr:monocarboxylate transporter 13 [Cuculus canorus]
MAGGAGGGQSAPAPRRPPPGSSGRGAALLVAAFSQAALVTGGPRALALLLRPLGGALGAGGAAAAAAGAAPLAALQLGGPLGSALSSRFGARPVAMAGGLLSGLGLLLGAFASHMGHLYLSVGLLAGLGWALVFTPSLAAVGRHFAARRAWATGLAVSGASVSGLATGTLVPLLLDAYGWRGALLLLAAISFNLVAAGALLPPLPKPPENAEPPPEPPGLLGLLRRGPFLRYAVAFVLVDAGYYVPFVHGEVRAHEVGCDDHRAGLVMAAMAAADGSGRVASGWLAARSKAPLLRHLFTWVALTASVSLLLPLGTSCWGLFPLAAAYGFCAGAVVPLQFAGVAEVSGVGRLGHAIGLMQAFESVGSLLGPPVAGWLHDTTGDFTVSFLTAGAFLVAGSLLILTLPGCLCPGGNGGDPTAPTDGPQLPLRPPEPLQNPQ